MRSSLNRQETLLDECVTLSSYLNPGFVNREVESHPSRLHGQWCMRGTRISLSLVIGAIIRGQTDEQIITSYPSLTHEHLQAAHCYAEIFKFLTWMYIDVVQRVHESGVNTRTTLIEVVDNRPHVTYGEIIEDNMVTDDIEVHCSTCQSELEEFELSTEPLRVLFAHWQICHREKQ